MAATFDISNALAFLLQAYQLGEQRKQQEREQTSELIKAYGGWEPYKEAIGEPAAIKAFEKMYGKKTPIPQRTRTEMVGELGPSYEFPGMEAQGIAPPAYTTRPRTEIIWPSSSKEIVEKATRDYLSQPGKLETYITSKMEGGSPWERALAEISKRLHVATLAQGSLTHRIGVKTPTGDRPITGPEAMNYWNTILEGETPTLELVPPTKDADKLEMQMRLAPLVGSFHGQEYATLDPKIKPLIDTALGLGLAQIRDGVIQPIHFEETKVPSAPHYEEEVDPKTGIKWKYEMKYEPKTKEYTRTGRRFMAELAKPPEYPAGLKAEERVRDDAHRYAEAEVRRTVPGGFVFDSATGTHKFEPKDPRRANEIYKKAYKDYFEQQRKRLKSYGIITPPLEEIPDIYSSPTSTIPREDPLKMRR